MKQETKFIISTFLMIFLLMFVSLFWWFVVIIETIVKIRGENPISFKQRLTRDYKELLRQLRYNWYSLTGKR